MTSDADAIIPFNLPLTREQFASALRKGQGRALLHVKRCGVAGFEDLVVQACTHSLVFDTQSEGTRGWWLFNLLGLAGMKDAARPKILESLREPREETSGNDDTWTVCQRLELAALYAQEGDEESRQAIYAKFDLQEYPESWVGGQQVVAVDGLKGFLHVAKVIGARLLREPDLWEDDYILSGISEELGRETVMAALTESARTDEQVRAYLNEVERSEHAKKQSKPQERKSLDEVLEMIEHTDDGPQWPLMGWGYKASQEQLAIIVSRMQMESRVPQLRGYLRVFRNREVPGLPDRVFELTESADDWIREAAFRAISNSCDTRVRDLAIDLLRRTPPCLDGLSLFAKNYQPGDHTLLQSVLPCAGDEDVLHGIALDLVRVAQEVEDPQLSGCLLWIYERNPCSFCRRGATEDLVDRKMSPRNMLEECLWDCQEETRELAQATFNAAPPSVGK
jgi:hypothetical protein